MKCQSCRNEDPTVQRRYYGATLCSTCDEAHRMVHTSVYDACLVIRRSTSIPALRKALYTENRTRRRKDLVTAIERRIRKLTRAAERSEGSAS